MTTISAYIYRPIHRGKSGDVRGKCSDTVLTLVHTEIILPGLAVWKEQARRDISR